MSFYSLIFYFLIIIPSAIIHEYAHGWMADRLGDPTARYSGRLTLDPRRHIDLWGTIVMPIFLYIISRGGFLFAYAKPVPYNPYNLKNQKWGPAFVALAGPLVNFLLALAFAFMLRCLPFLPSIWWNLGDFFAIIIYANLMLLVFNLIPLPPLDGSKLLYALLPDSAYQVKIFLERHSFAFLLVVVLFVSPLISPIISFLFKLLTSI